MSDEKQFSTQPTINPRNDIVWAKRGEKNVVQVSKHAPQVRVWAGICKNGMTSLHFFEGNLNSEEYVGILEQAVPEINKLLGNDGWWLQQDGATSHTAHATRDWLVENVPHFIPARDWPANSPDLNPMENLWGIMDQKIKAKAPKTAEQLKQLLEKVWKELPAEMVKGLVAGVPQRLTDVIRNKGAYIEK
jgi:inhibitor of nuclear factor kappa-B kinase subunit alpha